jgi:hypothetical protein
MKAQGYSRSWNTSYHPDSRSCYFLFYHCTYPKGITVKIASAFIIIIIIIIIIVVVVTFTKVLIYSLHHSPLFPPPPPFLE